ncbi:MAG: hypothetical protein SPL71_09760 [Oribacterium sp.]|nr:hypothetical protein [Oribacterium sp.]
MAIDAGERALHSLKDVQKMLDSAGNWGLVDMFGGNMLSGFLKHKKINDASECLEDAKHDLKDFTDELDDVSEIADLNIDVGDVLTFADFFFDGFLADFLVQSKISNAKKQVREAIRRVEDALRKLKTYDNGYVDI